MTSGTRAFWFIYLLLLCIQILFKSVTKARHYRTIRAAKRIYKKINSIQNNNRGWIFSYLRKIDPFVFEELLLFSFRKKGFRIKRNRRYTHDGGIDGKCVRKGETFLIQAKRYSEHIKEDHVRQFIRTCRNYRKRGYFIHTGKTGKETRELIKQNPQIKLISGEKLYELFLENKTDSSSLYF